MFKNRWMALVFVGLICLRVAYSQSTAGQATAQLTPKPNTAAAVAEDEKMLADVEAAEETAILGLQVREEEGEAARESVAFDSDY